MVVQCTSPYVARKSFWCVDETLRASGFVTIGPALTSGAMPATSTLNFPIGDTRANGVTGPTAAGGNLDFMYWTSTTGTTAQVLFDVTGYFS